MKTSRWPARWGVIGTQQSLVGVQGDLDGKALRVGRAACLFGVTVQGGSNESPADGWG